MNKEDVVCLYYALKIKLWVEFIRTFTFLKYPANMHNVSLRTFVECICLYIRLNLPRSIYTSLDARIEY